ncbi:SPOR domain-containing protein [Phyllobacterium myrsinacearum]|uniref:SPOR domain-containing protein n=1 Tax=Phyllobacterium myrsinacearum TaxID=28101 RepID=A0A839EK44_9HYPH|nr:SPOR domain-containing protein [Phyllobacterium myrsinacearum]MBA8880793.1 hypothetical protein [Phyllobacterium myrsinacearum]
MADNYLQRSHRQDDSRIGNDDPLMELSRIMGTPAEEENSATGSSEDLAMDLERELMGDFDEHPETVAHTADTVHDHSPAAAQDPFADFDLQDAVERELMSNEEPSHSHPVAEPVRQVVSEPAAIYEEADYADYEAETAYVDSEAGEGVDTSEPVSFTPEPPAPRTEPAALYTEEHVQPERAIVAAPSLSLEDELETLLAGSAKPVIQRSGNASWGYGSQAPVAGRTEAAPVISRATAYVPPAAQPAPVAAPPAYVPEPVAYQAPAAYEPVQVQETAPVQDDPLDDFDTEELMAAFDDFEVPMDIEDTVAEPQAEARAEEIELPRYQNPVQSYDAFHEPAPVAALPEPVAETHHLPEPQDLSGYADELDRAASSIASAPDVHTMAVTENRVEPTETLDLPEVHYEDDVPQHNGLGELETEFAEVFGSIEAEDPRAAHAAPQEEAQPAAAPKDEYADIFADVFGNEAEKGGYTPANYAAAGAGVAAAAAGLAAAGHQARPVASNYSNGPEDDMDFGYDPKRDDVGMAATAYAQPAVRKRSFVVPGAVAAAVLIAVSGAVAYKWTSGSSGTPVVIMADKTPIKVQPETAATATAPAQDKIVYEKGATADTSPPKQQQLVTTQEQPVDLAADEDEDVTGSDVASNKAEERVDPAAANVASTDQQAQPNNAIAPRKVQTMVVKPDGTMVAAIPQAADPVSSGPAAAPVARPAPATASAPVNAMPDGNDQIGSLAAASNPATPPRPAVEPLVAKPQVPASGKLPAKAVETKKITSETVASVSPKNVPVVDRPADQPLNVVDRVAPQKAAAPTQQVASAATPGGYLIQVASQPTVEGAQKTYASLSQRYPGVIGGRGVDIKQAEIAGKGTFFRVRIPAGSKDDAVNLCTKYKSAGGSCFVTQ